MGAPDAQFTGQALRTGRGEIAVLRDGSLRLQPDPNEEINLQGNTALTGDLAVSGAFAVGGLTTLNGTALLDKGGAGYNAKAEGCLFDGVTDDTDAFQALVTKALANGDPIIAPRGTSIISTSIFVTTADAFSIRGGGGGLRGNRGTQFLWNGNATEPMWRIQDCNHPHLSQFSCRGSAAKPLAAGAWLENISAGVTTTEQHSIWDNVIMDGAAGSGAGLGRGWVTINTTGDTDANNDFHEFRGCIATNYNVAGWLFNHSQSKGNMLFNCGATPNNTDARVLVAAGYDWDAAGGVLIPVTSGGSYSLYGFQGARGAEASFITSVFGDVNVLSGVNVERVVRLLIQGHTTANTTPNPSTILQAVRANYLNTLHADGYLIVQNSRGALTIDNLRVEGNALFSPQIKQACPSGGGIASYATLSIRDSYLESESTTLIGSQTTVSRAKVENCTWRNKTAVTWGNYDNGDYAGTAGGPIERWGTGSPESALVAPIGSVFHRTDSVAPTTSLYIKESGAGNTGWIAK